MKKKPVWVDQEAHAILKAYSKLSKKAMVDVASELVLTRLGELSPDAGLQSTPAAPAKKTTKSSKPKLRKEDRTVRYLGGVWLV